MAGYARTQTCPYCKHEVDDYEAVWEFEGQEEVECNYCNKVYVVKPQYEFVGWMIEKQCEKCGEWTEDELVLCDCEEED